MKAKKVGLVMFCVGAVYMFVASWLIMWWVTPIWRNSPDPVKEFEGTIWAYQGLAFTFIGLSMPVGIVLTAVGILLYADSDRRRKWPFVVFVGGIVAIALSCMFPQTLGYYPTVFGISGGLIFVFFFAALWFWAKNRRALDGPARTAAGLQLVSYVFFLASAMIMCALLGNPYSGLYFPEKVLKFQALPVYYSMGTKLVTYFALGWLFNFLSQYIRYKGQRSS
ncbi:MAG: hypothetical protein JSU70_10560 [Phycisphaerales bacterium]|nr:MAG: hypothetical protein JSU70_10560 [Phycisphaerales bacterium]